MTKVINSNGHEIGSFDGSSIKTSKNEVLYRIIDGEVYAPIKYIDSDLHHFNKGLLGVIGTFEDGKGFSNGELLFELSS